MGNNQNSIYSSDMAMQENWYQVDFPLQLGYHRRNQTTAQRANENYEINNDGPLYKKIMDVIKENGAKKPSGIK